MAGFEVSIYGRFWVITEGPDGLEKLSAVVGDVETYSSHERWADNYTFDTLVSRARYIVTATVSERRSSLLSEGGEEDMRTTYTLNVLNTLKGQPMDSQ